MTHIAIVEGASAKYLSAITIKFQLDRILSKAKTKSTPCGMIKEA